VSYFVNSFVSKVVIILITIIIIYIVILKNYYDNIFENQSFEKRFMNRKVLMNFIFYSISIGTGLCGNSPGGSTGACPKIPQQDTISQRQVLYNGIVWKNIYHRIKGDQFLFSGFFMPGTVSINGRTFKNVRYKYDIFSDEIITPVNSEVILRLNKEMVDSFSIAYEDKVYKFINIRNDTIKGFTGYANLLYKGSSSFYVKYRKSISPSSTTKSDGDFIQDQSMYLVKDSQIYPIKGTRSLYKVLTEEKEQIRSYIKKNKLRISKKMPESYVPVIRFYDSISQ
jgi:hypothetical protein